MKYLTLLSLVAASAALVILEDDVMQQLAIEFHSRHQQAQQKVASIKNYAEDAVDGARDVIADIVDSSTEVIDDATESAEKTFDWAAAAGRRSFFGAQSYADAGFADAEETLRQAYKNIEEAGHHKHKHGHHKHKPNQTVYELIAKSKYTTKLASLINEFPDLVEALNGTAANYTVFAPIDKAFEKIPEHVPKPSKEELKQILLYHTSKEFYPARRVLVSRTIPSLHIGEFLGGQPQRLSTDIGLKGLTINHYHRVVAVDIFGTNGVIHGLDSIIVPPPKIVDAIQSHPDVVSTLELALTKTGLLEELNDTSTHTGGTLFAPTNYAFSKLPSKVTSFLFSKHGLKYLRALLEYHIVPDLTLYTDAYWEAKDVSASKHIPKGRYHIDLHTCLKGHTLSVDIARWARFIYMKVNAFNHVTFLDGIVADGVTHAVGDVLIPPKKIGGGYEHGWDNEEVTVEELVERLEPYLEKNEAETEL